MGKEYQAFKRLYVESKMKSHSNNPAWSTFEKAYDLLGGADCVYEIYCATKWISTEAQQRILGFTMKDVEARMNQTARES